MYMNVYKREHTHKIRHPAPRYILMRHVGCNVRSMIAEYIHATRGRDKPLYLVVSTRAHMQRCK